MRGVNKVILIGHVGKDPEAAMAGDTPVSKFTLATNSFSKSKVGERRQNTEWHRIVAFGKLAEISNSYVKKGLTVYVEGSLKTSKWKDKAGVDRTNVDVIISTLEILDKKQADGHASNEEQITIIDDDIGF
jgi:single-strand DNA-binding protein